MARVFCIANQKGGVGKTTTAINLASAMAKSSNRTLVVDLDPQCNATSGLGHEPAERHPLLIDSPIRESILETSQPNLFLMPGCRSFQDVDKLEKGRTHSRRLAQATSGSGHGRLRYGFHRLSTIARGTNASGARVEHRSPNANPVRILRNGRAYPNDPRHTRRDAEAPWQVNLWRNPADDVRPSI